MDKGVTLPLLCCCACFVLFPAFAVHIASIVIGFQNMDAACEHGALVEPSIWLVVNGILGLVTLVILLIMFGALVSGCDDSGVCTICTVCFVALNFLFMIAWNIVGAVSLFRDSMSCITEAKPLFTMSIVVLVFQWLGILGHGSASKGTGRSGYSSF